MRYAAHWRACDMSDPVEIAGAAVGGAAGLGALAKITQVIAGVIGSRKDRARAAHDDDTATERAAEMALRLADRAEAQLGTCEERLAAMDARVSNLEIELRDHRTRCVPRIDALEAQERRQRRLLDTIMRATPPYGTHPDDVRAALAALQETGP
jgi:hypothetical protein